MIDNVTKINELLENNKLTKEQEQTLFYLYNEVKENSNDCDLILELRNKIALKNINLIYFVIKIYHLTLDDQEDLFHEGYFGLVKAIDLYNPQKDTKFSTYAIIWIRQSLTRYIQQNHNFIRIPVHMNEKIHKLKKIIEKLSIESSNDYTISDLKERTGFSEKELQELLYYIDLNKVISLNLELDENEHDPTELGDLVIDPNYDVDEFNKHVDFNNLRYFLDTNMMLNAKEKDIIKKRFGFNQPPKTLQEIADEKNITRERVRQIESSAIKKLRSPINKEFLEDYQEYIY